MSKIHSQPGTTRELAWRSKSLRRRWRELAERYNISKLIAVGAALTWAISCWSIVRMLNVRRHRAEGIRRNTKQSFEVPI